MELQGNDFRLEVDIIPVSDVDRAKRFYEELGWRVDADFTPPDDNIRVVQLTPPGSECSIIFGRGVTSAAPGSTQGLILIVSDIEGARRELISHGVEVSEVFHDALGVFPRAAGKGRASGPDPKGRSYRSYASFSDPDGNGWLLQEVKTRLPGRGGLISDVGTMTELLREAEEHHGKYEPTAPKHHWSQFYGAYMVAREQGKTPDEAAKAAAKHVEYQIKLH
jgi:catechol 2,3-dioxygenase-like lactoylglutathione lyase family enzyme